MSYAITVSFLYLQYREGHSICIHSSVSLRNKYIWILQQLLYYLDFQVEVIIAL